MGVESILETLVVRLTADGAQFTSAIRAVEQHVEKAAGSVLRLGAQMSAAITAPVAGFLATTAAMGAKVQATRDEFAVLTGSMESATRMLGGLKEAFDGTHLEMPELQQAARQMLNLGMPAEKIVGQMQKLGSIALGTGSNVGTLADMYGKVFERGSMSSRELLGMASSGIPIIQELSRMFGVSKEAVGNLAEQGVIKFATFQRAIDRLGGEGSKYARIVEAQRNSIVGMWGELFDESAGIMKEIGLTVLDAFDVKGMVRQLGAWIGTFRREFLPPIKEVLTYVGGVVRSVLVPAIEKVNAWIGRAAVSVKGWVHWLMQLPEPVKRYAALAGVAAVAMGPFLLGLGAVLKTAAMLLTPLKAVAAVVGVFASWPVAIAAAVVAWATLTESGQSFVSWVWSGLQPVWQPISDAIGGVTLALTNGEWGTAGQIAMLGLKVSVLRGLDGILGAFGGFGRNVLKGFLNVVKFVGEIWLGAVNAIADTIINNPKLAQAFGIKDTKQQAWELKADRMKVLGASAKHTKTVMDNTTDPAEKSRLEGVYKKQMDAARAAGTKSIAEYQREIAGFNTQANASNYAAWIQGWRAQIDGLTNGLDELGNTANATEAEQRRLIQGLKDMEEIALSDAAALILGATWDDLEAFNKPLKTATSAAEDLHDQLSAPFTAKFSVEGVEALESGSAKAVRALHAYASGFAYPRKPAADDTVAGWGAAGQSATATLDAANAPARQLVADQQVAAGTTAGYEFLQGTSITAAEWDATKQALDTFIASHDATTGGTGVNTAGTITGNNTAGPGDKAEETQGKLVELFGKLLELSQKLVENTAPQRNTSGTVLVPANLEG